MLNSKAFTLVELLVVVAIIGILAAVAIPGYSSYKQNARVASVVSDLKNIHSALEAYRTESNSYPDDVAGGSTPPGLAPFLKSDFFTSDTPVGGRYDYNAQPVWGEVSIRIENATYITDDAGWEKVDGVLDDGDLGGGKFRNIADGKAYVVSEDIY